MLVTLLLKGFEHFLKATPHRNVSNSFSSFHMLLNPNSGLREICDVFRFNGACKLLIIQP